MCRKFVSCVMTFVMLFSVVCCTVHVDGASDVTHAYFSDAVNNSEIVDAYFMSNEDLHDGDYVVFQAGLGNYYDRYRISNVYVSSDPTGEGARIPVYEVDGYIPVFYYRQSASDTYVFIEYSECPYDMWTAIDKIQTQFWDLNFTDDDEYNQDAEMAVAFCYSMGLMIGAGSSGDESHMFRPNNYLTRGSLWELLARCNRIRVESYGLEDNTEYKYDYNSSSVGASWYVPAMEWVQKNRYSDGTNYQNYVTIEQVVEMLYRCFGIYDSFEIANDIGAVDYNDVHSWAKSGVDWAISYEILRGDRHMIDAVYEENEPYYIEPTSYATREDVATIIYRFFERIPVTSCLYGIPLDIADIVDSYMEANYDW